jgi:RTX calcium-binding nonapeptide repeat (4 copies)
VKVDVVDDAGARDSPEVPAEVVALRCVDLRERADSVVCEAMDLQRLVVRQLAEFTNVPVRRHHEVPGRVRVLVDEHHGTPAPVHDERRLVIVGLARVAEEAAVQLVGLLDVLEPPGRPEGLRHCAEVRGPGRGSIDILIPANGNDIVNGGSGFDFVDYGGVTRRLRINLGRGTAFGEGRDRLVAIEGRSAVTEPTSWSATGTRNELYGEKGNNDTIEGRAGRNLLHGGLGTDHLDGGTGRDSCRPAETRFRCP